MPSDADGKDDTLQLITGASVKWNEAVNDFSELNREFVITSINHGLSNIDKGNTKLVISKKPDGTFEGGYLLYLADSSYDTKSGGEYSLRNFSGAAIYMDATGKYKEGYKIVDGKVQGWAKAARKKGKGNPSVFLANLNKKSLQTREQYCFTYTVLVQKPYALNEDWYYWAVETFTQCYNFGSGGASPIPNNSVGGGTSLNYNMNDQWGNQQPETLFDNNFENSAIKTYLSSKGFGSSNDLNFFATNQNVAASVKQYLGSNPNAEKKRLARQLVDVLQVNTIYKLWLKANSSFAEEAAMLDKYVKGGFIATEYIVLKIQKELFSQVDGFLNNKSFSNPIVTLVKHYLSNSNESQMFVDDYGGPSFEVNPINYLKCFVSRPNSTFKVSVCVAQPKENSRTVNLGLDAGHTFLTLEQSFNGQTIRRSIGFYPESDWQVVTSTPNQPAKYANNDLKGYNVSISSNLNETQFLGIVNNIRNYSNNGYHYDLHKFNCSTFAVNAVEGYGFSLPRTEDNFSKGKGMTPSNLAEDIKVMSLQPGQTRDVSSGKKTPLANSSSSDCN